MVAAEVIVEAGAAVTEAAVMAEATAEAFVVEAGVGATGTVAEVAADEVAHAARFRFIEGNKWDPVVVKCRRGHKHN